MDEEEQNEKENLEKVLQKYQTEIRTHIKTEKELEKLAIELNQKVDQYESVIKVKDDYLLVRSTLSQKLERDYNSLLTRNDELESKNHELKKAVDIYLPKPKSVPQQVHRPESRKTTTLERKGSAKSKTKKPSPKRLLPNHRILRSYNAMSGSGDQSALIGTFLNKTHVMPTKKKSYTLVNSSVNDMGGTKNPSLQMMLKNAYFVPKQPIKK